MFRHTLFTQPDPILHANRKRIVAHGYSALALKQMEPAVDECLALFLNQMSRFSRNKDPVDLTKWSHFFAFDVIGELAFSETFGMLEKGEEDEHLDLVGNQMDFGTSIGMLPCIVPFAKRSFPPIPWITNAQQKRDRLRVVCGCLWNRI